MKFAAPMMAVACLASPLCGAIPQEGDQCFERLTTRAIERPRLPGSWTARPQFDVSPDGRDLVYVERTASTAFNEITDTLWLSKIDKPKQRIPITVLQKGRSNEDLTSTNPTFAPDGSGIAVLGGSTAGGITILSRTGGLGRKLYLAGEVIVDFRWSPDGRSIAAQVSRKEGPGERQGFDVPRDWDGQSTARLHQAIVVIDVASGAVIARTPPQYEVAGIDSAFSWAPDGHRLALSASGATVGSSSASSDTDLFLFDVATQKMESITSRPGPDMDPQWSPDGASIAYVSGNLDFLTTGLLLKVVNLVDRQEKVLPRSDAHTGSPYQVRWVDPSHLAYSAMREMACPAYLLDTKSSAISVVADDGFSCFGGVRSGRGSRLYLSRQNLGSPGEIVFTDLHHPNLETLKTSGDAPSPWRVDKVSWDSSDGDYHIHGVLIRPPGFRKGTPLLISIPGGPGMVSPDSYNDDAMFLPYGPLVDGYAILVPNTRGRGGYGPKFEAAIRDRKDYMAGPLSDVTGAVDFAAKSLGVPRGSVALAGFSYGGILATYAAGNSTKFKLVMAMEGVVDFYSRALMEYGGPNQRAGTENMGFGNPYDEGDRRRLVVQSPLSSADTVQTPVLLECGANSLGPNDCLKYFRTANVRGTGPVDLAVYPRTGHMLSEPALRLDSARRQRAWLKRWLPLQPTTPNTGKSCYGFADH